MNIIHTGRLRKLQFTLAEGDLFECDVDAIVTSEQTDFVLSSNPTTLSGQVRQRYGRVVTDALFSQTRGHVLGSGTVIATTGGNDFRKIYHAGFHEPDDWPGTPGGSEFAYYFEAIGCCIDQVLQMAKTEGVRSVAFPLLGCGLFGLDERMLLLQFLDAIENFDRQLSGSESLHVWLVIRERSQFDSVVGVLMGLLLDYRGRTVTAPVEPTGVSILDRFSSRLASRSDEDWMKWQLCRYSEIALEIMCFGLCLATEPAPEPETLLDEGMPATFGAIREKALKFAASPPTKASWGAEFFSRVLLDPSAARALEVINKERNNLAHGRQSLSLGEIQDLVQQAVCLSEWAGICRNLGEPDFGSWKPWTYTTPELPMQTGLFERWQRNAFRYLVPDTGQVFKVRRKLVQSPGVLSNRQRNTMSE